MKTVDVGSTKFTVPESYEFLRVVGQGAYGTVASFIDDKKRKIAIKKVSNFTHDLVDGRRIVREIRLLQQLHHPCLLLVFHILPPKSLDFSDVYIASELMDTDLHRVIYSKQPLSSSHIRWWMAQLLRGLQYLHEADIAHRDIKPSNLLVNVNCDLKIGDLGLARVISFDDKITAYVCTRWYRAPEVILTASKYTSSVDMWSAGCVLAELIQRRPLFPGTDHLNQIQIIIERLGRPTTEDRTWIKQGNDSEGALGFLDSLTEYIRDPLLWDDFTTDGLDTDLLTQLVQFNPNIRFSATKALEHPYVVACVTEQEAGSHLDPPVIDWTFDNQVLNKQNLQNAVFLASAKTNPFILARDRKELEKRGIYCSAK